jgi:hypothetical protein
MWFSKPKVRLYSVEIPRRNLLRDSAHALTAWQKAVLSLGGAGRAGDKETE